MYILNLGSFFFQFFFVFPVVNNLLSLWLVFCEYIVNTTLSFYHLKIFRSIRYFMHLTSLKNVTQAFSICPNLDWSLPTPFAQVSTSELSSPLLGDSVISPMLDSCFLFFMTFLVLMVYPNNFLKISLFYPYPYWYLKWI